MDIIVLHATRGAGEFSSMRIPLYLCFKHEFFRKTGTNVPDPALSVTSLKILTVTSLRGLDGAEHLRLAC